MDSILWFSLVAIALQLFVPESAGAYIGPGVGISAIGTVVALIAAVFLAIVGFLWYPIKRLLAKLKKKRKTNKEAPLS